VFEINRPGNCGQPDQVKDNKNDNGNARDFEKSGRQKIVHKGFLDIFL
jgi:hypothetical protein